MLQLPCPTGGRAQDRVFCTSPLSFPKEIMSQCPTVVNCLQTTLSSGFSSLSHFPASLTFQLNYLHLNSCLRVFLLGTQKKIQDCWDNGVWPGTQTFYVSQIIHYKADKEERGTMAQLKCYHSGKHLRFLINVLG